MMKSIFEITRQQLKDHVDLVPLVVILGSVGVFSCATLAYTTLRKEDIIVNRWSSSMPWMRLDPTKHQQTMFETRRSKELYKHDDPLEELRNEIYEDGRFMTRSTPEDSGN